MKNLITYLKTLWSRVADSQSTDVSHDCRLTVGSPSGLDAKWMLKLVSVLVLILTIGVGNARADATVGTTLFSENFGDYSANDVPSGSVSSVVNKREIYGGGSVTYTSVNGTYTDKGKTKTSYTKIYNESTGGGTAPELLVGKNAGTFTIEGIPTGNATGITLTYMSNKNPKLSSSTTDVSFSSTQPTGTNKEHSVTITIPSNTATFNLTFTAPSDNARLDNILMVVETAGGGGGSVAVTGVSVAPTTKSIIPGETFTITPTVSPADATDKSVSWASTATSYATVNSSGLVTGVAAGSSTITCTTHDGSFTATCAVTVRGVTLQALDEDGYAIAGGGPGAPTRSGTTISPAADAGNYVFKEWQITNASLGSSASTKSNTITNPTGAVTVTAVYYKPITITYKANSQNFTTQTYAYGEDLAFPVSDPDPGTYSCDGKTFVGWVAEANKDYSHASTPPTYATAGGDVTAAATYYAVFATAGGGGTTTKTDEFTYTSFFSACNPSGANVNGAYTNFSSKSGSASDAVYAGNIMQHGSGPANCKDYIQLRSNNSTSGIITTTSGGKAKKVTVEWNSTTANAKVLNIYGKSTAYSAASDLYADATDGDLLGTITKGTSTEYTITGDYEHIGLRSSDGSVYFDAISIDWQAGGGVTYSDYATTCGQTIYLKDNANWRTGGSKYAVYYWNPEDGNDHDWSEFMTAQADCESTWKTTIPSNYTNMKFVRFPSGKGTPAFDGDVQNQTGNLTIPTNKNCFTLPSDAWDGTTNGTSDANWSAYAQKVTVSFDKNTSANGVTNPADQCVVKSTGYATEPTIGDMSYDRLGYQLNGWWTAADGGTQITFNEQTYTSDTELHAHWSVGSATTVYLLPTWSGEGNTWLKDNSIVFAHFYIDGTTQSYDVQMTGNSCDDVMTAEAPYGATHVSFARCTSGTVAGDLSATWATNGHVQNYVVGCEIGGTNYFAVLNWGSYGQKEGGKERKNTSYEPVSYTITYNAGTNGTGSRANDSKLCGVAFTLPNSQVFTRNGYTMDGWATSDGGDKSYNLGGSYTTDANLNLYPHWREATYTVTLTTNGGTINAGNVENYTYGTGATLPTNVTKDHATFQGWYASSTFEGDRVYTIGTTEYGNKQYYAKWEDIKWTVTWKANGETFHTDNNVVDGNTLSAPTPAPGNLTTGSNGCDAEFVGWVLEDNDPGALSISSQSSTPSGLFTTTSPAITANTTFVAIYRQEQ